MVPAAGVIPPQPYLSGDQVARQLSPERRGQHAKQRSARARRVFISEVSAVPDGRTSARCQSLHKRHEGQGLAGTWRPLCVHELVNGRSAGRTQGRMKNANDQDGVSLLFLISERCTCLSLRSPLSVGLTGLTGLLVSHICHSVDILSTVR